MKKNVIILGILMISTLSFAQIGINTSNPNPNAALDIVSANKGLLPPRLALVSTASPAPLSAHVAGMVVYNTATVNDVIPALYYNDGTKWVLAKSSGITTNILSSSGNTVTSTVNGVSSSAPAVNSNGLSLSGSSLSSTVNGVLSNSLNLAPAIAAATTNVLALSGSNLTSTVNGVASTANLAPLIASATTNTLVSGGTGNNTITSTVNGVASSTTAVKTVSNISSGNNLSTTVNGVTGTAVPIINSNTLSLSGSNLTSTVNGISSTALNLGPAITAATTNLLSSSGNTMTSTVNGIARTAPIINSVTNTVSGNTLTTTVNGISSSSVTLPQGVNIYNSDGTLNNHRVVSMNRKELFFQQDANNEILFDIGSTITGVTRIYSMGSSNSLIRAGVGSRALDMELLSGGSSRLLSTGSTELFVGTNSSSGPLVFGVGTNRAILATNGNFGIGTTTPSQKLDVIGNIRATGSLISGTTTYPDYVFEGYYKGFSKINPAYTFKKLDEVENFIKEKGHLPGYQSLDEVKQKDMTVDVTQNSITNMEKIEELYLHMIELNKKVKSLEEKNAKLEKLIQQNGGIQNNPT